MYKSVFQINKTLTQPAFKLFLKQYSKIKFAFKVHIKEPSTFMINLFLFNDKTKNRKFCVFTADTKRRKIKLNHELIKQSFYQPNPRKGEAKVKFYQKFKLQPNKYIFQFELLFKKVNPEEINLLLKIGSVSECTFEEITNEDKTWW